MKTDFLDCPDTKSVSWQSFKFWRERFNHFCAARRRDQQLAKALAELRSLSGPQLADIGLHRSELTREGLVAASQRRRWTQDRIPATETLPSKRRI